MASNFPHPFNSLKQQYNRLWRELPLVVSNLAMNDFKQNFRRQGYEEKAGGVVKWRKRKKNKGNNPILIKSGRLRRSFSTRPSFAVARVINNAPYAKAMNEGDHSTVRVRSFTRKKFQHVQVGTGVYSVKTKKERLRGEKRVAGSVKVKSFRRKNNLVARPFMITTDALIGKIGDKTDQMLKQMFHNAKSQ